MSYHDIGFFEGEEEFDIEEWYEAEEHWNGNRPRQIRKKRITQLRMSLKKLLLQDYQPYFQDLKYQVTHPTALQVAHHQVTRKR